jgi:hypothetical protein
MFLLTPPPPFEIYYSRLATFSYKVDIFFCNDNIDFHLIYNFFPSESIYSILAYISYAKMVAVFK